MADKNAENSRLDMQIKLIAQGRKTALEALYQMTKTSVYAYSLSLLGSVADAEDAMQEVYLEIWQSAGSYKSVGKPMGWIITLTKNVCFMKLRSKKYVSAEPLEPSRFSGFGLCPEESAVLRGCLEALTESEREVILLHAVSGLKHREIAEITGLSLTAVLSRYHRSIKKLRKMLLE